MFDPIFLTSILKVNLKQYIFFKFSLSNCCCDWLCYAPGSTLMGILVHFWDHLASINNPQAQGICNLASTASISQWGQTYVLFYKNILCGPSMMEQPETPCSRFWPKIPNQSVVFPVLNCPYYPLIMYLELKILLIWSVCQKLTRITPQHTMFFLLWFCSVIT